MKAMVDTIRKILNEEIKWLITLGTIIIAVVFGVYNPINEVNNKVDLLTYQVTDLKGKSLEVTDNGQRIDDLEKDVILLYERCGIEKKTGE